MGKISDKNNNAEEILPMRLTLLGKIADGNNNAGGKLSVRTTMLGKQKNCCREEQ
jgi:hypothetical protein